MVSQKRSSNLWALIINVATRDSWVSRIAVWVDKFHCFLALRLSRRLTESTADTPPTDLKQHNTLENYLNR